MVKHQTHGTVRIHVVRPILSVVLDDENAVSSQKRE